MLKKTSSIQLDSRFRGNDGMDFRGNDGMDFRGNDGVAFCGDDGVVISVYFVIPAKAGIHFFDFRTFIIFKKLNQLKLMRLIKINFKPDYPVGLLNILAFTYSICENIEHNIKVVNLQHSTKKVSSHEKQTTLTGTNAF